MTPATTTGAAPCRLLLALAAPRTVAGLRRLIAAAQAQLDAMESEEVAGAIKLSS